MDEWMNKWMFLTRRTTDIFEYCRLKMNIMMRPIVVDVYSTRMQNKELLHFEIVLLPYWIWLLYFPSSENICNCGGGIRKMKVLSQLNKTDFLNMF